MKHLSERFDRIPWLPFGLAALGGLVYAIKTWKMAHSLATLILDESMYIYKGYLFAIGRYAPYQDYGPLTNHMPLSFMIPGYIQAWFGPGMETARVFAFLVGLVMLAGIWLAFFRAGGRWWGAIVVWIFVLTPAWQEVFSQGLTQGLVNAFIAWAFVLLLGEERQNWQLVGAAILLVLSVLTRINTLPILGVVLAYIFWQHGWKKGLLATLGAVLAGVLVLSFFWPDVLKFLAGWVPEGLLGFVEPYRSPWQQQHVPAGFSYFPLSAWIGQADSEQVKGMLAFIESINFNFIPYLAVAGTLIYWPRKQDWPNLYRYKFSVLLLVGWFVMAGMHSWVALSGKSCHFFCLAGYFTFFNFLGLLLLPLVFPYCRTRPSIIRQVTGFIGLFGIVVAAFLRPGYQQVNFFDLWRSIMKIPIPRLEGGKVIWGQTGPLLSIFESKLKISYHFLIEQLPIIIYILLLYWLVFRIIPFLYVIILEHYHTRLSISSFALVFLVGFGGLMGGSKVFYGETPNLICADNVVETHEHVAGQLKEIIPEGSLLYWSLTSNILLLYLPEMEIFPPQLNTNFNYVQQSTPAESDQIYRMGYWDQYLDKEWMREADYLLVPGQTIANWQPYIDSGEFRVVGTTDPYETCRPSDTTVTVLQYGGVE